MTPIAPGRAVSVTAARASLPARRLHSPARSSRKSPHVISRGILMSLVLVTQPACSRQSGEFTVTPAIIDLKSDDREPPDRQVVVQLENSTNRPANVLDVRSTCGCVAVQPLESTRVDPGQSMPLALRVSLPEFGSTVVEVTVQTDQPGWQRSVLTMNLSGKPMDIPRLVGQTPRLELAGSSPGEPLNGSVYVDTIEKAGSLPLVTGLSTNGGSATIEPVGAPAEGPGPPGIVRRRYRFQVTAAVPVDDFASVRLSVVTREVLRNDARSGFNTTVCVRRDAPLRVIPAVLLLSPPRTGWHIERQVVVTAVDGIPFQIHSGTIGRAYSVEHSGDSPDVVARRHVLSLRFDMRLCDDLGEVELGTTHPRCSAVSVPVHVLAEE